MKSLLFDFGGTLDGDGVTWLDRFFFLYREAGIEASREDFCRAFYASDDALPARHDLRGLSLEDTVALQVRDVLAVLAPDRPAAKDLIVGRYLEQARAHFERNRPLLEKLAGRYRLGVVSNFYGNLDGVLKSEGLRALFGAVADSGVVGSTKPDPKIFLHALRELGSEASESVMVGDSVNRDMRGAEGLGMAHALLSGPETVPCCPKAWTLRILPDLEPLLS